MTRRLNDQMDYSLKEMNEVDYGLEEMNNTVTKVGVMCG